VLRWVILLAASLIWPAVTGAQTASAPLILEAKIPLGQVSGRIDHLGIDVKRRRLLVAELGVDLARHVGGNREADARVAGDDRRVDADDLALHVDERPAGVARIDRGVGLKEIVERSEIELPRLGTLTREELRAVCDREKTKEKIVEALRR